MADVSFDVVCIGAGNKNLAFGCWASKYGGSANLRAHSRMSRGRRFYPCVRLCSRTLWSIMGVPIT
jgi:hypothetical protein